MIIILIVNHYMYPRPPPFYLVYEIRSFSFSRKYITLLLTATSLKHKLTGISVFIQTSVRPVESINHCSCQNLAVFLSIQTVVKNKQIVEVPQKKVNIFLNFSVFFLRVSCHLCESQNNIFKYLLSTSQVKLGINQHSRVTFRLFNLLSSTFFNYNFSVRFFIVFSFLLNACLLDKINLTL